MMSLSQPVTLQRVVAPRVTFPGRRCTASMWCANDTRVKINGCCGTSSNKNFKTGCSSYYYTFTSLVEKEKVNYCLTYNSKYKMEYTSNGADDIVNGVLQVNKVYQYTPCAGTDFSGTSSGGSTATTGKDVDAAAEASLTAAVAGTVVATMFYR